MARPTKYRYLRVLQADYGFGHGWEDIGEAERDDPTQRRALRDDLRAYRANMPEYPYRVINRRELRQEG